MLLELVTSTLSSRYKSLTNANANSIPQIQPTCATSFDATFVHINKQVSGK